MSREFKLPKRITIELTDAEERFYRQEYNRLGLGKDNDLGGWIPGPRETIISKIVEAAGIPMGSDSEQIESIRIKMDDWPGASSEVILRDLFDIMGIRKTKI